jgi:hypothetical protein
MNKSAQNLIADVPSRHATVAVAVTVDIDCGGGALVDQGLVMGKSALTTSQLWRKESLNRISPHKSV